MARERWVRYEDAGRSWYGVLEDDRIREGTGDPFRGWRPNGHRVPLASVRLLPPVVPGKIVAVGLNYRDHAAEMGKPLPEEPLLFLKPSTSVIGPGGTILCPPESERVDYEGELAVVIRRRCRRVDPRDATTFILGYCCLIDVTARDLQTRDVQYTRAKGFDTFCPLGPRIQTGIDALDLAIETRVNGEVRQSSRTGQLVFAPPELVSFASQVMTLEPGDVISTGTPAGVGRLAPGDSIDVRIEEVGSLRCNVAVEEAVSGSRSRGSGPLPLPDS